MVSAASEPLPTEKGTWKFDVECYKKYGKIWGPLRNYVVTGQALLHYSMGLMNNDTTHFGDGPLGQAGRTARVQHEEGLRCA
ncbi:hypothetical protein A6R68_08252 [Neotoma lepida]|uniref:Uncharacterized protein n=1 Tax=Neotoma lepida TaxID=56216 RepID=A0A1A6G449_NEOLE|nr:hypothetical protein A6R68_08252 [Neotoma lepida]